VAHDNVSRSRSPSRPQPAPRTARLAGPTERRDRRHSAQSRANPPDSHAVASGEGQAAQGEDYPHFTTAGHHRDPQFPQRPRRAETLTEPGASSNRSRSSWIELARSQAPCRQANQRRRHPHSRRLGRRLAPSTRWPRHSAGSRRSGGRSVGSSAVPPGSFFRRSPAISFDSAATSGSAGWARAGGGPRPCC